MLDVVGVGGKAAGLVSDHEVTQAWSTARPSSGSYGAWSYALQVDFPLCSRSAMVLDH